MKLTICTALFAVLMLICSCGSKQEHEQETGPQIHDALLLSEMMEQDSVSHTQGEEALNYDALTDEQKQAEILRVLKKIITTRERSQEFNAEVFSRDLQSKVQQGWYPCAYDDGLEEFPRTPVAESIKITKFDPATGQVTYTLNVAWENHEDNTSGTDTLTETATFKFEDGKVKMDKCENLQMFA